MDTDLDTDTNILVKKDSWAEWVYFHKNDILFGIFFIGLVGIVILFTDTSTSTSIINLNNLQSLTDNLFTITHKDVYTKIGEIVQKAIFKEVSSQKCIKILEKLLKEYKDYPSLVSDSEE